MSDHFKPEGWARPGSWADDGAFREVVIDNVYKLPPSMTGWTCVDVGGHVGSFIYAALERGAKHVHSIEADPRNYDQLLGNVAVHPLHDRVTLQNGAAWRSDRPGELLGMASYDDCQMKNTGSGSVARAASAHFSVPAIPLGPVIEQFESVDFLKMDCEGSEFPVLFTLPYSAYAKVKRIAAELHPEFFWKREAVVLGRHTGDLVQSLGRHLVDRGFTVTLEDQPLNNRPLMFATKP